MTIIEAINRIDTLKPNRYELSDEVRWLSTIDGVIKAEIIDTHEGGENIEFKGYREDELYTKLIADAPYDDIYVKWLEAQIDYANGEYGKYNNSITTFNAAFDSYSRFYNRTHMPKQKDFTHF